MSIEREFDAYYKWLGIPPHQQPPTYYALLGLQDFESDTDVIEAAATRQMSHVQTYKLGPHSSRSQQLLNEIARAKLCLLTISEKERYDQQLRARFAKDTLPEVARSNAAPMRVAGAVSGTVETKSQLHSRPQRARSDLYPIIGILSMVVITSALILFGFSRLLTGPRPVAGQASPVEREKQPGQRPIGNKGVHAPVEPENAILPRNSAKVPAHSSNQVAGSVGTKDAHIPVEPQTIGLPQKPTIVPSRSPNKTDAIAESRESISAPGVREDDRWINVTYNAVIVRLEGGKWEEKDSKSGRLINILDEVGHTDQYIEVSNPPKNHHLRLFWNRMEQKLNGKWGWAASGYWESEGSRAEAEARELAEKDTSNDSGLPTRWMNQTYNTSIYHIQGKQWAEADNKTGQVSSYLIKTSRTAKYLELFHLNLKQTYRVSARRLEAKDGKQWKWISTGRWQ